MTNPLTTEQAGRGPQLLTAEQRELFRICGQRILDNHAAGRKVSPQALADGRKWAALPQLKRAMSSGEPAKACADNSTGVI